VREAQEAATYNADGAYDVEEIEEGDGITSDGDAV
jgi:hypothetical protein